MNLRSRSLRITDTCVVDTHGPRTNAALAVRSWEMIRDKFRQDIACDPTCRHDKLYSCTLTAFDFNATSPGSRLPQRAKRRRCLLPCSKRPPTRAAQTAGPPVWRCATFSHADSTMPSRHRPKHTTTGSGSITAPDSTAWRLTTCACSLILARCTWRLS